MKNHWERGCVTVFGVAMFAALVFGVTGLQIEELRFPDPIKNGTETSVVLDCDYSLLDTDKPEGLMVKWFFNNDPNPVYQWIMNKKPQEFGVLKGKLNLTYEASSDDKKKFRALYINNPTPDLSGEYKCQVSTFFNETSQTKKMVIYVPGSDLEVTQTKQKENSAVNVTCTAEGVFPEPLMVIQRDERSDLDQVEVLKIPKEGGVYDIVASVVLEDEHLETPTTFYCELRIPEANYTAKKSSRYFPGGAPSQSLATSLMLLSLGLCLRL